MGDKKRLFNYGGDTCATVEALTKSGGACPQKYSLTENKTMPDREILDLVYKGLGQYFDLINGNTTDPEFNKNFIAVIKLLSEKSALVNDELKKRCNLEKEEKVPLREALKLVIDKAILSTDSGTDCGKESKKRLTKLL